MFARFRKKLHVTLGVTVIFALAAIFASTYIFFFHIIKSDFMKRAELLSAQYTSSASYRLSLVGEAAACFDSRYHLGEYFEYAEKEQRLNAVLPSARSYNLSISGASVITKNREVYYSDSEHDRRFLSAAFGSDLSKPGALPSLSVYTIGRRGGMLMSLPINYKGKEAAYLIADINADRLFSAYDFEHNPFFSESRIVLKHGGSSVCIYDGGAGKNAVRISNPLGEDGITLDFYISPSAFRSKQLFAFLILLASFAFLTAASMVLLGKMVKNISAPLDTLYSEMNDYIYSYKE